MPFWDKLPPLFGGASESRSRYSVDTKIVPQQCRASETGVHITDKSIEPGSDSDVRHQYLDNKGC